MILCLLFEPPNLVIGKLNSMFSYKIFAYLMEEITWSWPQNLLNNNDTSLRTKAYLWGTLILGWVILLDTISVNLQYSIPNSNMSCYFPKESIDKALNWPMLGEILLIFVLKPSVHWHQVYYIAKLLWKHALSLISHHDTVQIPKACFHILHT